MTAKNKPMPVYQLSLEGFILNKFESITKAAIATGAHASHIAKVIKGLRTKAGGFKWEQNV